MDTLNYIGRSPNVCGSFKIEHGKKKQKPRDALTILRISEQRRSHPCYMEEAWKQRSDFIAKALGTSRAPRYVADRQESRLSAEALQALRRRQSGVWHVIRVMHALGLNFITPRMPLNLDTLLGLAVCFFHKVTARLAQTKYF